MSALEIRTRRSGRWIGLVLAGLLGVGLTVGSGTALAATAPARPARPVITITDFTFGGQLTVHPGATVTVRNTDTVAHTLTAADGSFTTKTIQPGKSATFKAPKAVGDHPITCKFHPEMTGTLRVSRTPPAHAVITITDFAFGGQLVVRPGATVTVRNTDTVEHTLTAADGSFTTKTIPPGRSATFKAPKAMGDYPVTCTFHPDMTGTLTVFR